MILCGGKVEVEAEFLFHLTLQPFNQHGDNSFIENFAVRLIYFQFLQSEHSDSHANERVFQDRIFLQALLDECLLFER